MDAAPPTRQEGPCQVFARLMAAVLDYDMNAQADLYAVDGILEWPFAPPGMSRHVEGREAIRGLLVPLGERAKQSGRRLREYDAVVIHETTDPEVIIVEFDVTGESDNDGPYRLSYIQVLRVRDGEIIFFRDYWNPQALVSLLARA